MFAVLRRIIAVLFLVHKYVILILFLVSSSLSQIVFAKTTNNANLELCLSFFADDSQVVVGRVSGLLKPVEKSEVAPQVLPGAKKSFWARLAAWLRLERIPFFGDLFEAKATRFELIGPTLIPEADLNALPKSPDIGVSLYHLKKKLNKPTEDNLNRSLTKVPEELQIELSNVFVTFKQADLIRTTNSGIIQQPIILGRFKTSDEPVLVYVMAGSERTFDISSISKSQKLFLDMATTISQFGIGLKFYGAQPIDRSGRVIGLVFASPGPVKNMAELGQARAVTAKHLIQIVNAMQTVRREMGADAVNVDFVVTGQGKVLAVPVINAGGSNSLQPSKVLLIRRAAVAHGLDVSREALAESNFREDVYRPLIKYFEMLNRSSREETFKFLDWLQNDRYLFRMLVAESFEKNAIAQPSDPQNLNWPQQINAWAEARGVDLLRSATPELPSLALDGFEADHFRGYNQVVNTRPLVVGHHVKIKTADIDDLMPSQGNFLPSGVSVTVLFQRTVVLEDGTLGFQFKQFARRGDGSDSWFIIPANRLYLFNPVIVQ